MYTTCICLIRVKSYYPPHARYHGPRCKALQSTITNLRPCASARVRKSIFCASRSDSSVYCYPVIGLSIMLSTLHLLHTLPVLDVTEHCHACFAKLNIIFPMIFGQEYRRVDTSLVNGARRMRDDDSIFFSHRRMCSGSHVRAYLPRYVPSAVFR